MSLSLYRIIIFGREIEKLKLFYNNNFGFSVLEEIPGEWVVLKAGEVEIGLHKIGKEYSNNEGKAFTADNNVKLVFRTDEDINKFRQRLIDNGVLVQEIKSFPGINSVFCDGQDVEGNIFQLEQRLS